MGRTSKAILLTPAAWDNCGLPEHLLVAFSKLTLRGVGKYTAYASPAFQLAPLANLKRASCPLDF